MMAVTKLRTDSRTGNARRLRRDATPEERKLWAALRHLDFAQGHFRRQAPIGPYFADFAHHGLRLVIELDGGQHGLSSGVERDDRRTADLQAAGYRVLRFWNNDVHENLSGVVEAILATLAAEPPTPDPSPPPAGGGEPAASQRDGIGVLSC